MKNFLLLLPTFVLFAFSPTGKSDWKSAYKANGIEVFTRTQSNGLTEFKGLTEVNAPMAQIAALLEDIEQHKDFVYGVKKGSLIKKINSVETVVYSEIEMPWPLENRDIVSQTSASYDKAKEIAIIKTWATPEKVEEKNGLQRMNKAEGFWKLEKISDQKTKITYQFVSDPGGLPNWVVSMFIVNAPKETLLALKEMETTLINSNIDVDWID